MIDTREVVAVAASDVFRRFRSYVDRSDLVSEGWLWVYEHPARVDEYQGDENEKRAGYRILRDITTHMEKHARNEKSIKTGYNARDEYFYNSAVVGFCLPAIVNGDYEVPVMDTDGSPATRNDPSEGGNWLTLRADVAQAWEQAALTAVERRALSLYYVYGYTEAQAGDSEGVSQQTISKRLKAGMRKLVDRMGGSKPTDCPFDCECHEGKLRQRPGVHSEWSGVSQEIA